MDGADYKGLIISLFTLTAMVSRPFSGKLADTIGRIPVIMIGALVCMVCSLAYPFLSSISAFFLLRFVHGFSTGFTPTGTAAYVSDIIPADRRGEALGLLGMFGTLGMAGGPAIGGWTARVLGLDIMFYLSSLFGFISAIIVVGMQETLPSKQSFKPALLKIKLKDVFEPRVILPCIVMGLGMFAYGAMLTLISDFGEHVGIHRKELLFTYFTLASFAIRIVAGKASDRYGRVPVLVGATAGIFISMIIIAVSETELLLTIGMICYGFAAGALSPTLLAWATDLSEASHKGRALASLYIFMELGIGLGALFSGWLFTFSWSGFFVPFVVSGVLAGIAFIALMFRPVHTKA